MNPITYLLTDLDAALANVTFSIFGAVSQWIMANASPLIKLGLLGVIFSWAFSLTGKDFAKDLYQYTIKIIATLIFATAWPYYGLVVNFINGAPNELGVDAFNSMTGSSAGSIDDAMGQFLIKGLETSMDSFLSWSWGLGQIVALIIFSATFILGAGLLLIIVQSQVFLAIWLGFGCIFFVMFIFGFTSGLFKGWLMQVLNYAFIPVIAYPVAAIFLPIANNILDTPNISAKFIQSVILLILAFISWVNLKQVPNSVAGVIGGLALGDEYRARRGAYDTAKRLFSGGKGKTNTVTKL